MVSIAWKIVAVAYVVQGWNHHIFMLRHAHLSHTA